MFATDREGGLLAHPDAEAARFKGDATPSYADHPLWRMRPSGGGRAGAGMFEFKGTRQMGAVAKAGLFYVAAVMPMAEVEARGDDGAASLAWLAGLSALAAACLAAALPGRVRREAVTLVGS